MPNDKNVLTLLGALDILAAGKDKKLPRISILAYAGGLMKVDGWDIVGIELTGIALPAQVPILCDHSNTRENLIGHGTPSIDAGKLVVNGKVSAAGAAAKEIVQAAQNGFPWAASVGVRVEATNHIREGETFILNGKTVTAPAGGVRYVIESSLQEVSVTAIGADDQTSVSIAAQQKAAQATERNYIMTEAEKKDAEEAKKAAEERAKVLMQKAVDTDEALQAERDRLGEINASIDAIDLPPKALNELRASAIKDGLSVEEVNAQLLIMLRASRQKSVAMHGQDGGPTPVDESTLLTAAILTHAGYGTVAEKAFGPEVLNRSERLCAHSIVDIAANALRSSGQRVPSTPDSILRAAFSTTSMPYAIGSSVQKIALAAYGDSPATWRAFCKIDSLSNFKEARAIRPGFDGALLEMGADGEIKHASVSESTYALKLSTYGLMLSLSRQHIINDDASVFADIGVVFGQKAGRKVADVVYELLLANTGSFFSADNANYTTGSGGALSLTTLTAAITKMSVQRDGEDNDLDIVPRTLLVPPELAGTARNILNSIEIARYTAGGDDNLATGSPLEKNLVLAVEPRLSNTSKFTGASLTGWYLFAQPPANAGMVACFLNGVETPTVEVQEAAFNVLGRDYRVYMDFGAAFGDENAAVFYTGA